ncbi:MAG: formylglycine-generating enzyme family protein [Spirochaetes bacterium]|nr:formylglycine-generating enzyme family protein [Spirochaetota bacterium]
MKNGLLKRAALAATLAAVALAASSCNDSEMSVTIPNTVWIPAGTFTMGSPSTEIGHNANEAPQRRVTISTGFHMTRFPITQWQWVEVMGSNPVPSDSVHYGRWRPVVNVNWFDAIVFANRLSIMEGLSPAYRIGGSTNPDDWGEVPTVWDSPNRIAWAAVEIVPGSNGWRLPTEAQWEYAARAGTTTAFSNGAQDWDAPSIDEIAWTVRNSGGRTHNVGTRAANPWGLHDMHGNVWEWVWDFMGAYPDHDETDPSNDSHSANRVQRGGSFALFGGSVELSVLTTRSANRSWVMYTNSAVNRGFRLVRP